MNSISTSKVCKILTLLSFALACTASLAFVGCRSSVKLNEEIKKEDINMQVYETIEKYRNRIPAMMKTNKISGLSIVVVDKNDILWMGGYGNSNNPKNHKVTPSTLFSLQSNSKVFTALGVMTAFQSGILDLDSPITSYLPDFKVNSCYESNPQNRITLRHLLNHTAGFAHEAPIGNNIDATSPSFESHIKSIQDTWLRGKVGESYFYSNLGIDLAAWILEDVSGESFPQYMKNHVFDEIGISETTIDSSIILNDNTYALGNISPFVKKGFVEIPMLGAGGVYSNASDMGKFIQFFLNHGISDEKMILEEPYLNQFYIRTQASGNYGLGIDIDVSEDTYSMVHNGRGFGYNSTMRWYPEYGIGCAIMTNHMGEDFQHAKICDELLNDLITNGSYKKVDESNPLPETIVYNPTSKAIEPAMALSPEFKAEWRDYVGTYALILGGYEMKWYAKIAFKLGYVPAFLKFQLYEKENKLWLGNQPLSEYHEGLFFNQYGHCLDMRGSNMTWRNMKIRKIK